MPPTGINTGFGALARKRIPNGGLRELQTRNLVLSHAAGVGAPLPPARCARSCCSAASLALGHSGVRPELIELAAGAANRDVVPVVPSRGSVGASGDLAPLAHLALVLIGEGDVTAAACGRRREGSLRRA